MSRSASATPRVMDWDSIKFPPRAMTPRTFTPLYLSQDFQRDPPPGQSVPKIKMTQRTQRFPPHDARLVRLEEGPPMYRMLGYADKNSLNPDIYDHFSPGYFGACSIPRLPPNQVFPFGPGRFGLPQASLPYTTYFWSDCAFLQHQYITKRPQNRLYQNRPLPEERDLAKAMPEMAVPGTGVNSRCSNSGYHYIPGIPPPGAGRGHH